jgi:hypothetical protein
MTTRILCLGYQLIPSLDGNYLAPIYNDENFEVVYADNVAEAITSLETSENDFDYMIVQLMCEAGIGGDWLKLKIALHKEHKGKEQLAIEFIRVLLREEGAAHSLLESTQIIGIEQIVPYAYNYVNDEKHILPELEKRGIRSPLILGIEDKGDELYRHILRIIKEKAETQD